MVTKNQNESMRTVLLAAARSTPVAPRMAMCFARAGCRVAALYPSKTHPLAVTGSVESHHHLSLIDPVGSLRAAILASGAELAIPCDSLAVRHLHALMATLAGAPDDAAIAQAIVLSLGDPSAYLLIDSRHEIQTAARAEGLNAAESFAIGRATDPETLARNVAFPWVMKADYSWGGRGSRVVHNLAEARGFIRVAGAAPSLPKAAKQLLVNNDRAALAEWAHGKRPGLSAQRPVKGSRAEATMSCWKGTVLASICMEVQAPSGWNRPPARVRIIANEEMDKTARRLADRLELSGFHSFEFVLDPATGQATLTEFNSHCTGYSHLNAGPGRDPADAFLRRWLENDPAQKTPLHDNPLVALFPEACTANPSDPILKTPAYDLPAGEPELVKRLLQLSARDQRYMAMKAMLSSPFGHRKRQ
jgi:hypothetical protein